MFKQILKSLSAGALALAVAAAQAAPETPSYIFPVGTLWPALLGLLR